MRSSSAPSNSTARLRHRYASDKRTMFARVIDFSDASILISRSEISSSCTPHYGVRLTSFRPAPHRCPLAVASFTGSLTNSESANLMGRINIHRLSDKYSTLKLGSPFHRACAGGSMKNLRPWQRHLRSPSLVNPFETSRDWTRLGL